jgi:hypothetical protein
LNQTLNHNAAFSEWGWRVFGIAGTALFFGVIGFLVSQPSPLQILEVFGSLILSFVWAINLGIAFFVLHRPALWLLLSAPLALLVPYAVAGIWYSCAHAVCL